MYVFQHGELAVRHVKQEDEGYLHKWMNDPQILEFYEGRDRPHDMALIREHFYTEDETIRCMIELNRAPIGYMQFYEVNRLTLASYGYCADGKRSFGLDQFIGEASCWNRGIGQAVIRAMVAELVTNKQAERIMMDPQAWNLRAIACYERCGFKKVKLLEAHERHEGEWRDCWLMEYKPERCT
ncbi:GNAT family N-acetyltransferase [Paenibacillus sp. y28]|uniref:GNAT family N-acetyltransferase n=1 Tax=Paenibacillus sp. y28 TaxID=3129110 RepID=UPI00301693C2